MVFYVIHIRARGPFLRDGDGDGIGHAGVPRFGAGIVAMLRWSASAHPSVLHPSPGSGDGGAPKSGVGRPAEVYGWCTGVNASAFRRFQPAVMDRALYVRLGVGFVWGIS